MSSFFGDLSEASRMSRANPPSRQEAAEYKKIQRSVENLMVSAHELCIRSDECAITFSSDDLDDVRSTIEILQRFTMKVQSVWDTEVNKESTP